VSQVVISSVPADHLDRVRSLLECAPQKPYRYLAGDSGVDLVGFWLRELAAPLRGGRGAVFAAEEGRRLAGMAAYADLPWETRILGRPTGALKCLIAAPTSRGLSKATDALLRHVLTWARERKIEFLLCRTYTDDTPSIHLLESHGFLLMDTMLDYVYDSRLNPPDTITRPPLPPGVAVRIARASDEEGLADVAHACFREHFGRFHADERISREQATQIYVEWIRSCCHGYADWILVAETQGRLAGYSVWKKTATLEQSFGLQLGHYSIGAIHPDFARGGLFRILTCEGMRLFDGATRYLEGPTHLNNYAVQRGYAKLSWRVRDARHSFHKWLADA
jgi:GNAT superfamily N-acetyltransferase